MIQNSYNDSPTLYLISTPIGNLEDMTYRSVKILNEVSVVEMPPKFEFKAMYMILAPKK